MSKKFKQTPSQLLNANNPTNRKKTKPKQKPKKFFYDRYQAYDPDEGFNITEPIIPQSENIEYDDDDWSQYGELFTKEARAARKAKFENTTTAELINDGKQFFSQLFDLRNITQHEDFEATSELGQCLNQILIRAGETSLAEIKNIENDISHDELEVSTTMELNKDVENTKVEANTHELIDMLELPTYEAESFHRLFDLYDQENFDATTVEINSPTWRPASPNTFTMIETITDAIDNNDLTFKWNMVRHYGNKVLPSFNAYLDDNHQFVEHRKLNNDDLTRKHAKDWFSKFYGMQQCINFKIDQLNEIIKTYDKNKIAEYSKLINYKIYLKHKLLALNNIHQLKIAFWTNKSKFKFNEMNSHYNINMYNQKIIYLPKFFCYEEHFDLGEQFFDATNLLDETLILIINEWDVMKQSFILYQSLWRNLLIAFDHKYIGKILIADDKINNVFKRKIEYAIRPEEVNHAINVNHYSSYEDIILLNCKFKEFKFLKYLFYFNFKIKTKLTM